MDAKFLNWWETNADIYLKNFTAGQVFNFKIACWEAWSASKASLLDELRAYANKLESE
jgi:hypothetical protein